MDITVTVTAETAARLGVLLDPDQGRFSLEMVVADLVDHAQQGVYRPGSWERPWLQQAFGDDWLRRVVPDPAEPMFDRPKDVP